MRPTSPTLLALVAGVLTLAAEPTLVHAHGQPASLAVWGGYPSGVAKCQRAISFASSLCIARAIDARTQCLDVEATGGECDEEQLDGDVQEARAIARAIVLDRCSAQDVQQLLYIDVNEALVDVINICRDSDNAVMSAIYGPAMVGGSVASVEPPLGVCIEATSRASAKLVRYSIRQRRAALDRIAKRRLDPATKLKLLERAESRIERVRAALTRQIAQSCPEGQFRGLYSRSIATYLRDLAKQGDCFSGAVYVQDGVLCPPAVCGNGIKEAAEECDDANEFDGDGCRADCTRAQCDVFPTTFDLIQQAIFENHGCSADICHGAAQEGGLDLRAGASYESLIDVASESVPGFKRVDPGDKDNSLLWLNLAASTFPSNTPRP